MAFYTSAINNYWGGTGDTGTIVENRILTEDDYNPYLTNVTYKNCTFVSNTATNLYVNNYKEWSTDYKTYDIKYTTTNVTGDYAGVQGYYTPYVITGTNGWWGYSSEVVTPQELKKQQQREKLRSNLIIHIKTRAEAPQSVPDNERIAMESLREVITEAEFRKYVKYGFILVKGKSGDTYQIFRNRSHTKIWRAGKVIEEVCVRIKYETEAPPTDNVIAFRTIIQTDEGAFKKLGNVFRMTTDNNRVYTGGVVAAQGFIAAAA